MVNPETVIDYICPISFPYIFIYIVGNVAFLMTSLQHATILQCIMFHLDTTSEEISIGKAVERSLPHLYNKIKNRGK